MSETREVDVFWTVQNGKRWSIALTEEDAWSSLKSLYAYDEDPVDWTVERSRECVPITFGTVHEGHGETVELDENGKEQLRHSYTPIKVFWNCPRCRNQHSTDLFCDPIERAAHEPNPSIWFCETGKGLVLVHW